MDPAPIIFTLYVSHPHSILSHVSYDSTEVPGGDCCLQEKICPNVLKFQKWIWQEIVL